MLFSSRNRFQNSAGSVWRRESMLLGTTIARSTTRRESPRPRGSSQEARPPRCLGRPAPTSTRTTAPASTSPRVRPAKAPPSPAPPEAGRRPAGALRARSSFLSLGDGTLLKVPCDLSLIETIFCYAGASPISATRANMKKPVFPILVLALLAGCGGSSSPAGRPLRPASSFPPLAGRSPRRASRSSCRPALSRPTRASPWLPPRASPRRAAS